MYNQEGAAKRLSNKIDKNNNIRSLRKNRSQLPLAGNRSSKLNYESYLGQAQAAARSGNLVEAENFYQHAEHYFRILNNHTVPSH
ncbi:DUF4167 domain-containing protein [Phyllobacterium sp. K27]